MYFQFFSKLNLIVDIIEIGKSYVGRSWVWKSVEAIIYVAAKNVWRVERGSKIKSFVDSKVHYDVSH